MTKRYLVAAGLLATVCVAHADVLPAASASNSSTFLSQWTDGKGNDVTASNVLGGNVRLIGGVALGNDSAAQALIDKAAGDSLATGAVTVKRVEGVTGTFAVAASNYKAAAAAGTGISVTTDSHGNQVIARGHGSNGGGGGGVGGGNGGGSWGGSDSSGGSWGGGSNGGASGGVSNAAADASAIGSIDVSADPVLTGSGNGASGSAAASGDVPEPSSIALMMAGMMGAMSVLRRRKR